MAQLRGNRSPNRMNYVRDQRWTRVTANAQVETCTYNEHLRGMSDVVSLCTRVSTSCITIATSPSRGCTGIFRTLLLPPRLLLGCSGTLVRVRRSTDGKSSSSLQSFQIFLGQIRRPAAFCPPRRQRVPPRGWPTRGHVSPWSLPRRIARSLRYERAIRNRRRRVRDPNSATQWSIDRHERIQPRWDRRKRRRVSSQDPQRPPRKLAVRGFPPSISPLTAVWRSHLASSSRRYGSTRRRHGFGHFVVRCPR